MSLRTALPGGVKKVIKSANTAVSSASASLRLEPDFIVVGGQRCGTTSLFRALEQHPQVVRPTFDKGINYFDLNYARGDRWYRSHFPLARGARKNGGVAAFEASGYYLFHPLAPGRIARDLPDVKIVAMLRDPVERAYSAWKHESARGFETWSFEDAVAREHERTAGERARLVAEPEYRSFTYRHHSYAARGDYAAQLGEFYDRMPSKNIHVLYSEEFFQEPEREFSALAEFLGVDDVRGLVFDKHNARPSGPMPGRTRELLTEAFADQADKLEELVGKRPPW